MCLSAWGGSNGSGVTGQVFTWLEIPTQLASELGHQMASICDI